MIEFTIRITNPIRRQIRQEFDIRYGPKSPPEREFQILFAYLSADSQQIVRKHYKQWQKRQQKQQSKTWFDSGELGDLPSGQWQILSAKEARLVSD